MPLALRPVLAAALLLAACRHEVPPEPAPVAGAGLINVVTRPEGAKEPAQVPARSERERRLAVLEASRAQVLPCYQELLAQQPDLYGEVLVRFNLNPDGSVDKVDTQLDTVGSDALTACVERVVQGLRFPIPSDPARREVYPYLFTTDRTPAEVVRALKIRHGLLPAEEDPNAEPGDPERKSPEGTFEVW